MATKKAGSTAKKTTKKSSAAKPSTTKVTTVKAVETPRTTAAATATGAGTATSTRYDRTAVLTALVAEFIGTFLLTAAYVITKGEPLYLGFTLIVIVLLVGTLSGSHVNPIHTVGAWVTRKMTSLRALGYLVAQVLGAIAALGLLTAFIGGAPHSDANSQAAMLGQAAQTPELFKVAELAGGKEWYVFFSELVGALIFSLAVATALREKRDRVASAFTAGFGLFVAALFAGVAASYVSANAIINPAIAIAAVDWSKINFMTVAVYVIAPLIGGVLGFALSDGIRAGRAKDEV
jgi:aquaporin Z